MATRLILLLALLVPLIVVAQDHDAPGAKAAPAAPDTVSKRALELEIREAALRILEEDLIKKVEELKELRKQAIASIEPEENRQKADIGTLIIFYQSMKPKAAAGLLEKLPLQLASDVLGAMKGRQAGKILNVMNSDRAVLISRRMARK